MSASAIETSIKYLEKKVILGNTNAHTLLKKELSQLSTSNFTSEELDLRIDVLAYLTEVKQLVENLSKINLGNYSQFTATILDKDTFFIDVVRPKLLNLLSRVKASTGSFSSKIALDIIGFVIQDVIVVSFHLKFIKTEATKLETAKANKQQNTTPVVVANSSVKETDDLIQKICVNRHRRRYNINFGFEDFEEITNQYNSDLSTFCNSQDITTAETTIKSSQAYIKRAREYINNPAFRFDNFITPGVDTAKKFRDSIASAEGVVQDLNTFIAIKKGASTDTKVNPPKSIPTAVAKSSPAKVPTINSIPNISLPLTPDTWGIKFTIAGATTEPKLGKKDPFSPLFGPNAEVSVPQNTYFMDLLPARQSTIPVQGGRDVPNAMPGLNYKLIPQVGKQQIPGFSPVYQNLGIKGMQVTIVGAFTGADGSNYKTDTPDPNSKTPFWSNAKGSPTLSDNPGRGNKLPELTAYNSSAEFKQVVYQGKQIEVEINLFQVYNQSTASQIAQDIKLQAKNGNPKFTGIVRSFEEYHATKERTWYTLIMDVTDFGMASKKAINLNNKLAEAIRKAQAELVAAQQAEAQENATNGLIANAADQISKSNLSSEDKKKYMALVKWAAVVSKDVTTSSNFVSADTAAQFKKNIANKDTFSYVQVLPLRGKQEFLLKVVQNCNVPFEYKNNLLNTLAGGLFSFIFDPLVDISNDANNRSNYESDCEFKQYFHFSEKGIIKEFIGDGKQQVRGPFANDTRLHGDRNELKSLWNNKVTSITFAEGIEAITAGAGCITADVAGTATAGAIFGSVIPVVGTTVGGIVGLVVGTGTALFGCTGRIADSLNNSYYTRNDNDNDFLTMSWGKIFTDSLWDYATSAAFNVVGNVIGIKATGNSVRQSFKQGTVYKSLPRNPANVTNQISSFIPTLVNKAKANIGKTITYNGQTAIIEAVDGVPTINGKPAVRLKINNQTYQVPIEDITNELDNIVPSTVTTTTNSSSTNSPTANSNGAATTNTVDQLIDSLSGNGITDDIKTIIKQQPNSLRIGRLFNQVKNKSNRVSLNFKGGGTFIIEKTDNVVFESTGIQVNRANGSNIEFTYSELESSTLLPNVSSSIVQPQQPIVTLSALDNTINGLPNLSTDAKAALINLPNPDKLKALDILQSNVADLQFIVNGVPVGKGTTKPILIATINNQGKLSYRVQGSVSFNQIDLNNVTVSKPATVTIPPPSQSSIPQQQTTTKTLQTQQPGATYYPDGELNEVNIILGGFPEGLPAKGFKMFNILKNLGYEKQFSLLKKPSIKFKNPNTNEIKTVKALSFSQGTDNGDSIYIITGNKKGVFVNLIDIISINGIE